MKSEFFLNFSVSYFSFFGICEVRILDSMSSFFLILRQFVDFLLIQRQFVEFFCSNRDSLSSFLLIQRQFV